MVAPTIVSGFLNQASCLKAGKTLTDTFKEMDSDARVSFRCVTVDKHIELGR